MIWKCNFSVLHESSIVSAELSWAHRATVVVKNGVIR